MNLHDNLLMHVSGSGFPAVTCLVALARRKVHSPIDMISEHEPCESIVARAISGKFRLAKPLLSRLGRGRLIWIAGAKYLDVIDQNNLCRHR
ncbi:MAG: hypothetical protein ACI89J_002194 [Hyphomicrobiaceae bacterium]|jgi:hypothetical protein